MRTNLLVVSSILLLGRTAWAADVDCSSSAAVQSAIDAAADGDTLTCTVGGQWDSTVSIPASKGLTLDGHGVTVHRGNLGDNTALIEIATNPSTTTRITGLELTNTEVTTGFFIGVGGGFENAKFRIDHCRLTAGDMGTSVQVADAFGVIDHCDFSANDNAEQIHNMGWGPEDDSGWSEDVVAGSIDALYIEDNTFANSHLYDSGGTIYFWGNSALQSYYGARSVFRYNQLTMSQVDQHGTAGMIGARHWEIYENTFEVVPTGNQSSYVVLRAGSGVVFANHQSGTNLGSGGISLYEEDDGYPALYQVGRGKDQALDPAYLWGNDPGIPIGSGSANVEQNRDYYLEPKPNYVPLVHPHPLVTGDGGAAGQAAGGGASSGGAGPQGGAGAAAGAAASGGAGAVPDSTTAPAASESSDCGCRVPGGPGERTPSLLSAALSFVWIRRRATRSRARAGAASA